MILQVTSLIVLLLVHWLADFALQTEKQANNKNHSLIALGGHVLTYGISMGIAMLCLYPCRKMAISAGLLAASHFLIDFVTSKITHRLYEEKRYHDFFVVIGFDQFLHLLTIIAILSFKVKEVL